jgi:DNA replication protein DnaC
MLDPTVSDVIHIQAPDYRNRASAGMGINILDLLEEMTFERWDPRKSLPKAERENLAHAFSLAVKFSEDPKGWLTFSGTYGCGKTHLAAAIAHRRVAKGEKVLFVVVADLLDHLRAAFNPHSPVAYDRRFEQIRRVDFLVLDDLGTENATPWAREKLFQILNYRYNAALPTVITTAHTLEELDPWLATRIADPRRGTFWGIIAPSYRSDVKPRRGRPSRKRD